MKKLFILSALAGITMISNSCSSDSDDPKTPTEKQDFTNANYIKSLMIGNWKLVETNYSGSWGGVASSTYNSTYSFQNNNSYNYKPYTKNDDSSMNETGTFVVTPATETINAKLTLTYQYNGQTKTRNVNLINYSNGIVEISSMAITCPSGTCKERYQKQ